MLDSLEQGYVRILEEKRSSESYKILSEGNGYVVKELTIPPGQSISLQRHYYRDERWVVVQGKPRILLQVEVSEKQLFPFTAVPGKSIVVNQGCLHRIENLTDTAVVIIETWLGDDLREDDIERIEDQYGRIK